LDESAHACTRSELRGASCEHWKSALRRAWPVSCISTPLKTIRYRSSVAVGGNQSPLRKHYVMFGPVEPVELAVERSDTFPPATQLGAHACTCVTSKIHLEKIPENLYGFSRSLFRQQKM
jgi:hypothetical protein